MTTIIDAFMIVIACSLLTGLVLAVGAVALAPFILSSQISREQERARREWE